MSQSEVIPPITSRAGEGLTVPPQALSDFGGSQEDVVFAVFSTPNGLLLRPKNWPPIELYTEERIAEFESFDEEIGLAMKAAGLTQ